MKKTFFIAAAIVLTFTANAQLQTAQAEAPVQQKVENVATFNVETYNFGKIPQGKPVTYTFEIKNISAAPLVVESATASCGCTTPEKIVDPIMPASMAPLKIQYNAAAVGSFTKDVYVKFAGIDQIKTLHITGEVVAPDGATTANKPKEIPAAVSVPTKVAQPAAKANSVKPTTVVKKKIVKEPVRNK
jgi:hypothetical protein